jgi:transcription elongation factor Elf1
VRTCSFVRPDLSQRVSFTCPECQTEGIANLGAAEENEEVEVTCDYCQRVLVLALDGEDA